MRGIVGNSKVISAVRCPRNGRPHLHLPAYSFSAYSLPKMSLPGYTEFNTETRPAPQVNESQATLPSYSRRVSTVWDVPPAEQVHCFYLTAKKTGTRWLTLALTSRAASAVDTPTFYQGGDVAGNVKLDLEKEEMVDEITIAVSNRIAPIRYDSLLQFNAEPISSCATCSCMDGLAYSLIRRPTSSMPHKRYTQLLRRNRRIRVLQRLS